MISELNYKTMQEPSTINTVIIGGGQAGITLSYYLAQHHIEHLILERGRAFSAWYNRWDSFRLNTANWMNTLPGSKQPFVPHKKWYDIATRDEALSYFQSYIQTQNPPLKEGLHVKRVVESDTIWQVHTNAETYHAQHVAICTSHNSKPYIPPIAENLPDNFPQQHAASYRNPEQITTPNVLIVGSGSSGVQICHDLAQTNRFQNIYFATSNNRIIPWSILGIPIGVFSRLFPIFDIQTRSWLGKRIIRHHQGGDPAMAPSPQKLAQQYNIHLTGRVTHISSKHIHTADTQKISQQDLTIIWCTGYRANYNFLKVKNPSRVFKNNCPIHKRGVSTGAPNLYFVGLRYQHTLGSHLLHGVKKDAQYIARKIAKQPHTIKTQHT